MQPNHHSDLTGRAINHYRIRRRLGEGGMGVVWQADDERLGRPVALKMIRDHQAASPKFRERFWREARAAAKVNHPNVCQIYEVGEHEGDPFLVMEFLQGEPLDQRLKTGPVPVIDAVRVASQMLSALAALHREGLVHRDLKPSNLFLTPNGAKLLDFGLVRMHDVDEPLSLTQSGMMIGTPSYMSPEQASGREADALSDLFAAGAVLYEMLSGRRAFPGTSIPEILISVVNHQPPALVGSPEVARLDRVVARALQKHRDARYRTAEEMLSDLGAVPIENNSAPPAPVRAVTRLIVLPFRMLVPDDQTGFLAYSLPDAVSSTLAGLESIVVRSSMAAANFDAARPDLKAIAREAEVDAVVTGTLLRAGDQIRVTTQLVEAPGGTLLHSHSAQAGMRDLFQLQDELVQRLVESLRIPLTARDNQALEQPAPASNAYEIYLRANQLITDWRNVVQARDLYRQCVNTDSNFAPGWARLGRAERLIAKYADASDNVEAAEVALQRALSLNPDLALAHNLYAQLEADSGRAQSAMIRLLRRAAKTGNDPELFAGLVHVCRYCGLLEASLAAHERARRLDPKIATSVFHTLFLMGDYERCVVESTGEQGFIRTQALVMLGRSEEALGIMREALSSASDLPPRVHRFLQVLYRAAAGTGTREELADDVVSFSSVRDPEGLFYWSRYVSKLGETDLAMAELGNAVELGYYCVQALEKDPWLDEIRRHPDFSPLLALARDRRRLAMEAFRDNGGERLLCRGVTASLSPSKAD
ncbi:MAG: protein kinase [Bryobacteraceae bacterium]